MAACYDRASTIWLRFVWRHQANLHWENIIKYIVSHYFFLLYAVLFCPTCQGYSLTSVSTPPTILIRLFACPQVQVLPLEIGAAVGGVMIVATQNTDDKVRFPGVSHLSCTHHLPRRSRHCTRRLHFPEDIQSRRQHSVLRN